MNKYIILQLSILIFLFYTSNAQDIPESMKPPRMVNDFSGLLDPSNRDNLENKLQSFYYQTSTQIYVVILDDLAGYDISDFAFQLGEKWGVGTKGKDNGIVILLNPSPDRQHGDVFIATGYGLEEFVPDAITNRIVDYDMIPFFKEQKYYEGLEAATNTIIDLTKGEFTADEYIQRILEADGIIIGSPTYFSDLTVATKALIERAGYATGSLLKNKLGAAVVAVRRAGANHVFSSINYFFLIKEMIVVGSTYWNMGIGRNPGEVLDDAEGIQTFKNLGRNFADVLKKLKT